MRIQEDFHDVPAGGTIIFQHLLIYLEQGREIEFVYKDKEYFISNTNEGRALWIGDNKMSDGFNKDNLSFTESVKVDGIALAAIFKQSQAAISTVFRKNHSPPSQ
ncbi:hypothetical protein FZC79_15080 [Rossellomorea vietnamensis]|uniref:Uncharacterized protein n=1 Tax=Rossellomorea vietnamensis TaxID=218284 RepID=A0A5D4KDY7_9BACI|nr:hypothetical protein [Rossellomorea vietnamensis]TYR74403.1 hypothetical protein FZC79_15080 [Rossellomorea vietnamensis]